MALVAYVIFLKLFNSGGYQDFLWNWWKKVLPFIITEFDSFHIYRFTGCYLKKGKTDCICVFRLNADLCTTYVYVYFDNIQK